MARHVLSTTEKIRGLRGALASKATPAHLRPHLRRALDKLENGKPVNVRKPAGFLGFFKI